MEQDIEKVRTETFEGLKELFGDDMPDDLDMSYITEDLLADYEKHSKDKDPKELTEDYEGFPDDGGKAKAENWCFYGHHLTKNNGWWHWTNGNPNNGCDAMFHTCRRGHRWRFQITKSKPLRCADVWAKPAFCGN